MSETGVVKFSCEHIVRELSSFPGFEELNSCRRELWERRMIGVEPNGIGFGNVSIRAERTNQFYITGSGTGGLERLSPEHYSLVVDYDFARNWLRCDGRVVASSESLTHAAIYEADRDIAAVFHVHSAVLWKHWRGVLPTTNADVEYGTPAMAAEVRRLFAESDVRQKQIFVMAGHENGLVAFGGTAANALQVVTDLLTRETEQRAGTSREKSRPCRNSPEQPE